MGRFARSYPLNFAQSQVSVEDLDGAFEVIWDGLFQNVLRYATSKPARHILSHYLAEASEDSFTTQDPPAFSLSFSDACGACPTTALICQHWFEISMVQLWQQINQLLKPLGCQLSQPEPEQEGLFAALGGKLCSISKTEIWDDDGDASARLSPAQLKKARGLQACECDLCLKIRQGLAPVTLSPRPSDPAETRFKNLKAALKQPLQVRELVLSSPSTYGATHHLPDELGSLKRLRMFHVESASHIPETLGNLTRLEDLSLSFNAVETLPSSMGNLRSLRKLRLWGGYVAALPDEIGNLRNLKELTIHDNPVVLLPRSLAGLESLTTLELGHSVLDEFPLELVALKNLRSFQFTLASRHQPSARLCQSLARFPYSAWPLLESIQISGVPLDSGVLEELAKNQRLKQIHLAWTKIMDRIPAALEHMPCLEWLSLRESAIRHVPGWLGALPALHLLDLSYNQVEDVGEGLWDSQSLRTVILSKNAISQLSPKVCNLKTLESLDIDCNQLTTIPDCIGQLSRLKRLSVAGNPIQVLPESVGQLTQLTDLYIDNMPLLALPDSINELKSLSYFIIGGKTYPDIDPNQLLKKFKLKNVNINKSCW